MSETTSSKEPCSNCEENPTDLMMLSCRHEFCKYCLARLEETQCPLCVNIEQNKAPRNERIVTCNEHGLPVSFWCIECSYIICVKCVITHQTHGLETFENAQRMKQYLYKKLKEIKHRGVSELEDVKKEKDRMEIIYRKYKDFQKEIEKCKDEITNHLDSLNVRDKKSNEFIKESKELLENTQNHMSKMYPENLRKLNDIQSRVSTPRYPVVDFNKLLSSIVCAYQVCITT